MVHNVQFNLHKGMTTRELLGELHGRTAGENQRERALMFGEWEKTPYVYLDDRKAPESIGAPTIPYDGWDSLVPEERLDEAETGRRHLPKAQVVMEYERQKSVVGPKEHFALILEYSIADKDIIASDKLLIPKGGLVKNFYIAGVNDEGQYFVRPLQGIPTGKVRDIEQIMTWLNKEDLKYIERVQGDIVMRFVKATAHNKQYRTNFLGKKSHVSYWLPMNGNNKGFTDWYALNSVRLEKRRDFGGHVIQIKDSGHLVVPHKTGFFSIEPLIIDAREFIMTHPEHGQRTIQVPEGHYVALASQRGRDEITGHGVFD